MENQRAIAGRSAAFDPRQAESAAVTELSEAAEKAAEEQELLRLKEQGYPAEKSLQVWEAETQKLLIPAKSKRLLKKLPIAFAFIRRDYSSSKKPLCVSRQRFEEQWHGFSSSMFKDWASSDFNNVLVAGGAVLASLLPVPSNFMHLQPSYYREEWIDFDFRSSDGREQRNATEPRRSLEQFMQRTRWPHADIDLFIYGLSAEEANRKVQSIMKLLRKSALLPPAGTVRDDVVFVKTDYTVTVVTASPRRKVQIITRLYSTKDDVLNSFDIDCCAVGFDGAEVCIMPRCCAAISQQINTINLGVRGLCYEDRLLKYATRGFAIGVPRLKELSLDREYLECKLIKCEYGDYMTFSSNDWGKWGAAKNLARILMCERLAMLQGGVVEKAFPGRRRSSQYDKTKPLHFKFVPNAHLAISDAYDGGAGKTKRWPSTSQAAAFLQEGTRWSIKWVAGNPERHPLTWKSWSASVVVGAKRDEGWRSYFDSAAYKERQEQRKREEKQKKEEELQEVRAEATASMKQELDEMQQQLDDSICIICLDQTKSVVLDPCRHFCICSSCAENINECPVCRTPCTIFQTYG